MAIFLNLIWLIWKKDMSIKENKNTITTFLAWLCLHKIQTQ